MVFAVECKMVVILERSDLVLESFIFPEFNDDHPIEIVFKT